MKTLVINYTPRGEFSYSKKLLDSFLSQVKNSEVEILDLTKDVPDLFMPENLSAYIERNFMGQELSPEQEKTLSKMDRMLKQFQSADIVVLATPMYNFSLPATVKAWFDSAIFAGQTFKMSNKGVEGLMKGKKALVLMASGAVYEGKMAAMDHAMSLSKAEFQFMGFDEVLDVTVQGTNSRPDKMDQVVEEGKGKIKEIISKWYM